MPRSALLSFAEPHEYQERIRPAEVQIIPTARGDFRAALSQTELHHLTLQRGWQSLPVVARGALHQSRSSIMFHTATTQPAIRVDSVDLSPDLIALGAPGKEHFFQASSACSWASLTLTPAAYAAARATLDGDDFNPSTQSSMIRPPPAALDLLRALHHSVMGMVSSVGDQGIHPEAARSAEQALLTALVDCLGVDANVEVPRLGGRGSTAVMRRFYELVNESEGLPLYLMDVCARLGVSRRTLHNACVDHLDLSPHRFLWLRRMQLARQALIETDPGTTTVTKIAVDLGFWELGRFSIRYKWLFGESPSATLGRPRRSPVIGTSTRRPQIPILHSTPLFASLQTRATEA